MEDGNVLDLTEPEFQEAMAADNEVRSYAEFFATHDKPQSEKGRVR